MASARISCGVTTPPALRITCASPGASPSTAAGSMRASMHVTIAILRLGSIGNPPSSNDDAYDALLASSSSVTDMLSLLFVNLSGQSGGLAGRVSKRWPMPASVRK